MTQVLQEGEHILIRMNDGFGMNVPGIVEAKVVKYQGHDGYNDLYDILPAMERHPFTYSPLDATDEVPASEMVQPFTAYGDDLRWCRVPAERNQPNA